MPQFQQLIQMCLKHYARGEKSKQNKNEATTVSKQQMPKTSIFCVTWKEIYIVPIISSY